MSRISLRTAITTATSELELAGVRSPRTDAELLAAHLLGIERTRLPLVPFVEPEFAAQFDELIKRRAKRVPLQYLTGSAAIGQIDVEVGPGVFIPRPETELLLGWALAKLERMGRHDPVVVDLCTGSGALALAIAAARPDAVVHAVDIDPVALDYAQRNAQRRADEGDSPITLYRDDVTATELLPELSGTVDLVVSNPPYLPVGIELDPEVVDHDPGEALFGGVDGLSVITPMIVNIARLVREGGAVGIEHDDANGGDVAQLLADNGFRRIVAHRDLAGKPRFITADALSVTFDIPAGTQAGSSV